MVKFMESAKIITIDKICLVKSIFYPRYQCLKKHKLHTIINSIVYKHTLIVHTVTLPRVS